MNRNLARLGAEGRALDADDIADVPGFEAGVIFLAHVLAADVDLDLAELVLHMRKGRLAHDSAGHHAAGNDDLLSLKGIKLLDDLAGLMRALEVRDAEGVLARLLQSLELLTTDAVLFAELFLRQLFRRLLVVFCHNAFRSLSESLFIG